MNEPICWKCGKPFTETEPNSKEHILPLGIGGDNAFYSTELLHQSCNSSFDIDGILAKQFEEVMLPLGVVNSRRKRRQKRNGSGPSYIEYRDSEGNPFVYGERLRGMIKLRIEIRGKEVTPIVGETIDEIVARTREKYSEVLPENLIDGIYNLPFESAAPKGNLNVLPVEYGGAAYMKAITKIAINYALHSGVKIEYLRSSIDSVVDSNKFPPSNFYRLLSPPPISYESDEVAHTIHLLGDPAKGVLICFISLFSAFETITLLNGAYTGKYIEQTYSYDVLRKVNLDKKVKVITDKNALLRQLFSPSLYSSRIDGLMHRLNRIIEARQEPVLIMQEA